MLIIGSNHEIIKSTKRMLASKFDMKDMGVTDVILGIKISRTSEGLILSQSHYIEKILTKFSNYVSSPTKTPYDVNLYLSKNIGQCISQSEYARIIGSLMYITNCTRPDIAYSVNKLSRYTSNPGKDHWKAIARVLGYLNLCRTMDCTPQDIQQYLKANVMLTRYLIHKTRSPQVDMFLLWEAEPFHGNPLNKRV